MSPKDSSDFCRDVRRKLGLSQREFAVKLGVSKSSIPRYERPGYPMPKTVRLAIERLLDEHKGEKK